MKTLPCQYFKTTGPILMKLTGYNKQTHKGLHINFQSILIFHINLRIYSLKGYRWFPWSYMHIEKLKELNNLLIFYKNELVLS